MPKGLLKEAISANDTAQRRQVVEDIIRELGQLSPGLETPQFQTIVAAVYVMRRQLVQLEEVETAINRAAEKIDILPAMLREQAC